MKIWFSSKLNITEQMSTNISEEEEIIPVRKTRTMNNKLSSQNTLVIKEVSNSQESYSNNWSELYDKDVNEKLEPEYEICSNSLISYDELSSIKSPSFNEKISNQNEEARRDEVGEEQLHYKFKTDLLFTKLTRDFTRKLDTHFSSKNITFMEWTSFIKTIHNLFIQHIGKAINKNKYHDIDNESKQEYFLYLLNLANKSGAFQGEIFNHWKEKKLKTLEEIGNYWIVSICIDRLNECYGMEINKNYVNMSCTDLKNETQTSYDRIYSAIFKVLQNQKFLQNFDGN